MSESVKLRRVAPDALPPRGKMGLDAETLASVASIVEAVETGGEPEIRRYAERFGELQPGDALLHGADELRAALDALASSERELLERVASRIRSFATHQRQTLKDLDVEIEGGRAGHRWSPMERAGCYAPGGRFPLPSSVLMTAVTARVAGVDEVWVVSPKPTAVTLAAAAVAGADGLIPVGGAHAIAALAFGVGGVPKVDVIVGPGSRWVAAAKKLVSGQVAIDMIAGPSELVVLADDTADPATVAADLLAQAEHDDDAIPVLVTTSATLADSVDAELSVQLADLPTAATARVAVTHGFSVVVVDIGAGIGVCDQLAPEHLQLMCRDAAEVGRRLRHYGGLFVGDRAAEVFGDYGAGPNHVLPTGGTARLTGGLSVVDFMRLRTWLDIHDGEQVANDAARLARLEGLEGHARAAERRYPNSRGDRDSS
ncbi:MAG: histidinol dehydrogenase [Myxococcota bacterium]